MIWLYRHHPVSYESYDISSGGKTIERSKNISAPAEIRTADLLDASLGWRSLDHDAPSIPDFNSLIEKFFSKDEPNNKVTAYFFSALYYHADVWLLLSLSPPLKQQAMITLQEMAVFNS